MMEAYQKALKSVLFPSISEDLGIWVCRDSTVFELTSHHLLRCPQKSHSGNYIAKVSFYCVLDTPASPSSTSLCTFQTSRKDRLSSSCIILSLLLVIDDAHPTGGFFKTPEAIQVVAHLCEVLCLLRPITCQKYANWLLLHVLEDCQRVTTFRGIQHKLAKKLDWVFAAVLGVLYELLQCQMLHR